MAKKSSIDSQLPEILFVLVFFTIILWNPLRALGSDILLRIVGVYVPGVIVSAEEYVDDGPEGNAVWSYTFVYTFQTTDGKKQIGKYHGTGRLESKNRQISTLDSIVVEYLPRYPNINRPRENEVPQSWAGLMLRATIGLAFIAAWISVIFISIRKVAQKLIRR